jgi:hypothetical protein
VREWIVSPPTPYLELDPNTHVESMEQTIPKLANEDMDVMDDA